MSDAAHMTGSEAGMNKWSYSAAPEGEHRVVGSRDVQDGSVTEGAARR